MRIHFSHISSFCLIVFSFAAISITAQNNLEENLYYWEDADNQSPYYFNKATIEFKRDSVIFINYPRDPAGRLNYSSGTYTYNKDSTSVKCIITRSLSFSLNTVWVVYYRTDCNENIEFSIAVDKSVVRKIELKPTYLIKGVDRPKKYIELKYSSQDNSKRLIPSDWYHQFENYDKKKRLQSCP